jgi:acyl-CoA thioester hydrolase
MHSPTTFRVRYHECDPMGVAHHANYAPWFEIGRTELLRAAGVSYATLEKQGVFLVIAKLEVSYPVRYDDLIDIRTTHKGGGRVKIIHDYELWIIEPGGHTLGTIAAKHAITHPVLAATATTTLACVDNTGSLRPLPDWLATTT